MNLDIKIRLDDIYNKVLNLKMLKVLRKVEIWTSSAPAAEEECVKWLKAPEELLNGACGETV